MSDSDDFDSATEPELPNIFFSKKLLKQFIQLYKSLPCLWDRTCAAYKQKSRRHEGITKLTTLVQEHDPTATRVHVMRKIESLRACVRREYKRVKASRLTAKSAEEVYKPHLWYYDMLVFIFAEADGENGFENFPAKQGSDVQDSEEEAADDDDSQFDQSMDTYQNEYIASNIVEVAGGSKRFAEYDDDSKSKRLCTEVEDEYDAIGINVAAKLRNLPPNMRILAEKLVNDVLYQAQLNGLNSSTIISTPDPFKQDPM